MRIKNGFELRVVCGEAIVVAHGLENIDFSKIINLNESAAYLWKAIEGKDFTEETAVDLLLEEYEVDRDTAAKDVKALVAKWQEIGLIA